MSRPFSSKRDVDLVVTMLCSMYKTHETLPLSLVEGVIHNLEKSAEFARMRFYTLAWKHSKEMVLQYFSGRIYEACRPSIADLPLKDDIKVVRLDTKAVDSILEFRDRL